MKYYTKKPKKIENMINTSKKSKISSNTDDDFTIYKQNKSKIKFPKIIFISFVIIILFNSFLKIFEERILKSVLDLGEITMEAEAIEIINEEVLKIYSEDFVYEDIVKIDKDIDGNISMVRADTIKQNQLASEVILVCNERLSELGELGIEIPLGYITNNLLFYQLGPKVNIKMQRMGSVKTTYESVFESAGINQTRHKVYLNVESKIRVVVPFSSKDIVVNSQIPIADTIIVGEIPDTSINLK